jgi:hypothetical protein
VGRIHTSPKGYAEEVRGPAEQDKNKNGNYGNHGNYVAPSVPMKRAVFQENPKQVFWQGWQHSKTAENGNSRNSKQQLQ